MTLYASVTDSEFFIKVPTKYGHRTCHPWEEVILLNEGIDPGRVKESCFGLIT